ANPQGLDIVHATRFHPAKPITFAISANTPPEFKDAVREGVLYWNQAFGKDVVKVIDAPQGVVAPDLEYNVVQWVNWDGAGFAYADAQMDPRSGEILHAQVYMTSAFAYLGKWRARELFKKLKPSTHSHAKRVSLAGFMQDGMCDFSLREALEKSFDTILLNEKDEAKLLQAAQDYVREVMAHEIGHTLGLRHNFAGSLAANYALSEREQLMKSYFEKGQAPAGIITSSSVMEYQLFDEGVITGDQIKRKEKAYGYDEKAIRNLYYGEAVNPNEIPLFCTDSHAGQYVDCMRFDIGASSVEYTKWAVENYARNLPYSLISTYIIAKAPPYGADPVPVQQVSLNPVLLAKGMLGSRYALLGAMTEQGRLLKIHRTFGAVGTFNSDKVKASEMQYMANEAKRLGGLGAVLSAVDNAFAEREYKRFEELLDSGAYTTGVGPDGKKYTFTNDELALIKRDVRLAYEKLQLELVKEDINIMSLPTPPAPPGMTARPLILVEHELTEEIAALNALRVRNYALASTGEFLTGEMSYVEEVPASQPGAQAQKLTKVTTVKLPKFLYPAAIRVLAPAMLKDGKSQSLTWGLAERAKIKKDYTDLLTGALGGVTIEKVKPEELPVPMARWVLENRKVLTAVTGM
ncbi:MAG TPA: zinc-dependent metalloprotease, partial [Bdellovibrionales bacterium]|nr:zinc-dependent metalloprotease [Bdellovibrionales bacterium]